MPTGRLPQLGVDGRILEGIVTSENADGTVNIAPMGPIVNEDFSIIILRPFKTSTTYVNLIRARSGVLHVTDDVELFAAAAIGLTTPHEFRDDRPLVLARACRWYAFEVVAIDDTEERTTLVAQRTAHGGQRDFFGFNRARHAVIEAAILATRRHLLSRDAIREEYRRLQTIVNKTGAASEHRAFDVLSEFVESDSTMPRAEHSPS